MRKPDDVELERRLLVAVLLSMAILFAVPYVYEYFFPTPPVVETAGSEVVLGGSGAGETPVAQPISEPEKASEQQGDGEATKATAAEFEIENDAMIFRFSNVGACLVSARWKGRSGTIEEAVELVPQVLSRDYLRPLELYADDAALQKKLSSAVYHLASGETGKLTTGTELRFEYRDGELQLEKRITIPALGHVMGVSVTARRNGVDLPVNVVLSTGIGTVEIENAIDFRESEVAFYQNAGVQRYKEGDLEGEGVQVDGKFRWAAVDSKYFAFLATDSGSIRNVKMKPAPWVRPKPDGKGEGKEVILVQGIVGLEAPGNFNFFVGPKLEKALAAVDPTAPKLVDYGMFAILVEPLLMALKWLYGYVGNYGWAIILLTFFINVALFPIRYKQMASMRKMSVLQPELKAIQDKYKKMKRDDPRRQQMNTEVMALYKEHGVNPLGGCLPLLLQMPILFAFYRMLDVAIELRGAPFIWWIKDLSKADPYYVTPIVMGLTMVLQQKMTPATGDPAQRRMMMLLPIVFTFFFLGVSSGLAVYFLFSNLFAMMFQFGLQQLKPELVAKGGGAGKSKQKPTNN